MAVSAGIVAVGALAGTVYSADQSKKASDKAIQQQKDTAAQAEANRPQATKAPDAQGVAGQMAGTGQAGGTPGVAQTFLTGATGVDPDMLKLGKSTLLGG